MSRFCFKWLAAIAVVVMVFGASRSARATVIFTADSGKHARTNVLASAQWLDAIDAPGPESLLIETTDSQSKSVPWQADPADPKRIWWVLDGTTPAGRKRRFEWKARPDSNDRPKTGSPAATRIEAVPRDEGIILRRSDGKTIFRYNTALPTPPAGVDPKFARNACLHPIQSPSGITVTDQFPPDHLHQHGVWLGFSKTAFEGRKPNFWESGEGTGQVRFVKLDSATSGPIFGGLRARHEHVDLSAPGGVKPAIRERWDVRVWNLNGQDDKPAGWVFDIASSLECASDSPVTLAKNHYGGMAVRGSREWYGDKCKCLTSEGKDRKDGNQTRVRWSAISGSTDGRWAGIALLSHPRNTGFPEPTRIHPQMPFLCLTPTQLGDQVLKPGQPLEARYRFYVHDGEIPVAEIERIWRDFAEPPTVTVE